MTATPEALRRRLARQRSAARRVLWFERVWPAISPALGLIGLWVVLALLDLPALLPPLWHLGALVVLVAAIGGLLWRGLHGLSAPTAEAVDRRLEQASGLRHRPLVTLDDQPAAQDPASAILWQAHLDRAAAQVSRLRVGWPQPVLARLDQRALRGFLVVAIAAGLVVAGSDAPDRLLRSISPTLPQGSPTPAPLLQAWVTPPSYTGLPPIFLKPEMTTVQVPAGSRLHRQPDGRQRGAEPHPRRRCRTVQAIGRHELAGGPECRGRRRLGGAPPRPGARRLDLGCGARQAADRCLGGSPGCRPQDAAAPADPAAPGRPRMITAWSRCRRSCGCGIGRPLRR
ncbi:MAG: DUF4175 family protein [Acetobacteraceae bacterium]